MCDHDTRALMRALNNRLLAASIATDALHAWCEERGLGEGGIEARLHRVDVAAHPPPAVAERLRVAAGERVRHRRVSLVRGGLVLSDAENWFVPDRLPRPMREALERTNTPFGAVIRALDPVRRTFGVRLIVPDAPGVLFEHRAVVLRGDGVTIAVVHERYRSELLGPAAGADRAVEEYEHA